MGDVARLATADEQAKMEGLVIAAMAAGAYGLSGGPFYIPGKYSNTAEIVGLAKAAARFPGAFYISHVRDEGNYDIGVVAAVDEVIPVAREAKIPGVVTHIKVLGPQAWGKSADVRSEEHTSELQSLMRISYAVFCLQKKHNIN